MKKLSYMLLILTVFLLVACGQNTPTDLNFTLKYGVGAKNIINTYDSSYQKDLIAEGIEETELRFTDEEIQQIYNKMKTINILDYPSDYKPHYSDNPKPDEDRTVEPHYTYILDMNIDGVTKNIVWVDSNYSETTEAKDLRDLFIYIDEVIRNKEEYKKLPEAVGGYE
ncbi:MAG: hypothetical protein GX783_12645 [Clostridiales bacterium]|nr:hypothetical protein [Clostridiales bacterium]